MKTSKRILSLLLTIVMMLSIVTLSVVQSSAVSVTKEQAVSWANAQIGKSLDQDGVYGAQCVDLIRYYYSYLGVSPVSGHGCDYAKNALPTGWSRIQYYNGFVPHPGDIAVWTYASSDKGHVAIVTSADANSMNVVEQNGSTHVTRAHSYSYSYGTFYGVIRPNFETERAEPPDAPKVWLDKNIVAPDEQIRINFWSERAKRYWVGIYKDGNLIHDAYTEFGYYDVTFTMPGDYNVTVSADNDYGYTASYTSFVVKTLDELIPGPPTVWAEKTNLLPNEQVRLNFWSERAKRYWVGIYKDGNLIHDAYTEFGYYDIAFTTPGDYNVTVSADNLYGYKASYIHFTVRNPETTVSSISIQSKPTKTVYTVGEKFDASGLAVKVTMSDGTTKTITSGFTLSNPDMSTAGTKTVTVTYSGKTASFTITVNNPPATVSSIAIQSKPTKTVYTVGEKFDASGLAVKVTMSDGTAKTITSGFTLSNPDMSTAGTKTVTVSYSGKTTSFTITVNNPPATVSSIAIQSKPTKTVYTVGEKFDASGLKIKVTMSDGTAKIITSGFTLSNPDMSKAGTKSVTVTYSGKTTSFTITVKAAEPSANTGALRLITPASARVGQRVQIPVQLDKASLGTLTFTVKYDHTKLKYVSCTESSFDMCDVYAGNTGVIRAACIDNAAVSAGRIAVLTFEVIAPSACLTDLTLTVEEAYDGSDKAVSVTGGTWELSVVKTVLGDLNGDGQVTAIDARWALQAASGTRTLTEEQKAAADINGDGKVTAIDARWILQVASGTRVP